MTTESESESYVTTDGQSASLSWNKPPIWGLRPDLDYCLTVAGLLMWGALSDERTGLSFPIATCPRQRSHFRVGVHWDSRPYFTVSDSRLLFSSPPTTRRATVEVFDPASTRLMNALSSLTRGEPKLVCYYLFHPLQRNVCESRGNALISTSLFVATEHAFSEPLPSNGLFRHNIDLPYLSRFGTPVNITLVAHKAAA
jgi:hypothetical protein